MAVERRRFKRFDAPLDAQFKPSENPSEPAAGIIKNFSREGLCLESENLDMNLNETIELRVKLPRRDAFVHVLGDIKWNEQTGANCLTGIKIKEIDKEDKSLILDYAYGLWVDKNKD